ncbi:hypothetical protein ZWY2020_011231 [Hordeum vulgare]|nr:hypothetical protein ZWY2020_011231 [Hordeum vulgare]
MMRPLRSAQVRSRSHGRAGIQHPAGGLCAAAVSTADAASWWCAVALVALVLLERSARKTADDDGTGEGGAAALHFRGPRLSLRCGGPADATGVRWSREGETLHHQRQVRGPVHRGRNPHVHDPDDVFQEPSSRSSRPRTPRLWPPDMDATTPAS